jgi:glycosyltransferase involved in cell wall biosynthesis
MQNPLLSILIPTRNREEYTSEVVRQILSIEDLELQLVIQNNSDSNFLESQLKAFTPDKRLKYSYHSKILSFVDNFSLGLENCDGEYVIIIGDDDGINPFIMDIARLMRERGIEAITPTLPFIYYWPHSGIDSNNSNGKLTILDYSCKAKVSNPRAEVKKLLKNGCQNYLSFNLAKAYHGIIKKSLLEKIKDKAGKYIGGLSPDIYLSIACSLFIDKVVNVDYPLTISGICKSSGSADSATGRHTGNLNDAPHFKGHDNNYKWSQKVPEFYSVATIWADSALAAITEVDEEDRQRAFNLDILHSYCLLSYPQFKDIILKSWSDKTGHTAKSLSFYLRVKKEVFLVSFKQFLNKVYVKLFNRKQQKVLNDIPGIIVASKICAEKSKHDQEAVIRSIREVFHKAQ